MYDLIIIGAGPAGLTAALYALRANKKVLVLEAKSYGGQILNAHQVENYPGILSISGFDYATNLYTQVKNLGVELKYETVNHIDEDQTVITDQNQYQGKAVIIATGVQNRRLNLEYEQEYLGKGISYCATCDGNFYKNKVVAVVGGGNTALEDALYLSNIASKVYVIHRRNSFRGEDTYLDQLKKLENVEFILDAKVVGLYGKDILESIEVESNEEKKKVKVDGLFVAIGQIPSNVIFSNIIDLDEKGYIKSLDGVHTNVPLIYVAGDARVKTLRQLTTAVSDGAIAATTAINEMKDA